MAKLSGMTIKEIYDLTPIEYNILIDLINERYPTSEE
jgi:hypothetical protein